MVVLGSALTGEVGKVPLQARKSPIPDGEAVFGDSVR